MTQEEFSRQYNIAPAEMRAMFEKIGVHPDTPIDTELENILLNLSGTRVPSYPATRMSALSPAEIAVLIQYYDLHIHKDIFMLEEFYPFGKMLYALLAQEKRSIEIPASAIVELGKRAGADPKNPRLRALKALLVEMNKSGCGIVAPVGDTPGLSFAESVYRRCPGRHLAILSQTAAVPAAILREAEQAGISIVSFYLDNKGFLRVSPDVVVAPSQSTAAPNLLRAAPRSEPAVSFVPKAPAPPPVPDNGPLLRQPLSPLLPEQRPAPSAQPAPLLTRAPAPMPAASQPNVQNQRVVQAHPAQPRHQSDGFLPYAAPVDVTALTPGAVPYPFPGKDTLPVRPPMHMHPTGSAPPSPPFAPQQPAYTAPAPYAPPAPVPEPVYTPPAPIPAAPAPVVTAPPAPEATDPVQSAVPDAPAVKERVIRRAKLRKAGYTPAPAESAAPLAPAPAETREPAAASAAVKEPEPVREKPTAPTPPPAISLDGPLPDDKIPVTMKDRYVMGFENEGQEDDAWHRNADRLSSLLSILKIALIVLGMGIAGILLYIWLIK